MRIPGIVDVYQVGDQWIARSWPKVQNQPNSAAQLLWRKKFADAHAMIKSWSGAYLASWKAIQCPPGKMWIDIAMTSILKRKTYFDYEMGVTDAELGLYALPPANPFGDNTYAFSGRSLRPLCWQYINDPWFYLGANWPDVFKWNDLEWICAKGKRPKKKWSLSYVNNHIDGNGWQWQQPPYWCYAFATKADCSNGLSVSNLYTYFDPVTKETVWALIEPPLYFQAVAWPPPWAP